MLLYLFSIIINYFLSIIINIICFLFLIIIIIIIKSYNSFMFSRDQPWVLASRQRYLRCAQPAVDLIYMYIYIYIYTYAYIDYTIFLSLYLSLYIYIYIEREREREREIRTVVTKPKRGGLIKGGGTTIPRFILAKGSLNIYTPLSSPPSL